MNFGIFTGKRQAPRPQGEEASGCAAGAECTLCPSQGACRAAAASMLRAAGEFGDAPRQPGQLDADELGRALALAEPFAQWLEAVKAYALDELLAGRVIPGWKAVAGKSNRRFTDVRAAFEALRAEGFDVERLYERKPLSLAQVEKLVGKTDFRRIAGGFVERPAGKPVLAPEGDPRAPYCRAQ